MFYHFFGHTCSRVFHKYLYTIGSGRPVAYTDISFGGKLNRIVHQIVDNLAQAGGIGRNSDLLSRKDPATVPRLSSYSFFALVLSHSVPDGGDVAEVELHGVRLYLGEVRMSDIRTIQQLAVLSIRGKFDDVVLSQV